MKKKNENSCGYLNVDNDVYTYYVSNGIVTLLPAQTNDEMRCSSVRRIRSRNTDSSEYLFGKDSNNTMIAMLRKGKFDEDIFGINSSVMFATPIIIKADGNTYNFISMLTDDWCKFHSITFYGGNLSALYDPSIAVRISDIADLINYNGERTIKILPWDEYTKTIEFQIFNEKVILTISVGQRAGNNNTEQQGAYTLGKMNSFFQFAFERAQGFEMVEKYYEIARKMVAILTAQNNVCFEEVYLCQRNSDQKYFKTGVCEIRDSYENYSVKRSHNVIPITCVLNYIPNLVNAIVDNKAYLLLLLFPEDNKMANRISIKNVQDLCTALEVYYHLNDKRTKKKDRILEKFKKSIKKTIKEFTESHDEMDVNKETTISSAFQYLDFTLKQKIMTMYYENLEVVNSIISKCSLPKLDENSIESFVKLRNSKTHSGIFEWGENANAYISLFVIVYATFFKYIELPDKLIRDMLWRLF